MVEGEKGYYLAIHKLFRENLKFNKDSIGCKKTEKFSCSFCGKLTMDEICQESQHISLYVTITSEEKML